MKANKTYNEISNLFEKKFLRSSKRLNGKKHAFKDVRAHCYCASLQRKQIHMPRHASSARAKY